MILVQGIHEVLAGGYTDDAVMEVLFRYWGADRESDPGPGHLLHDRLLAVDPTIGEHWDSGRQERPRFFSNQDIQGDRRVVEFMKGPGWSGTYGYDADTGTVWQKPEGSRWSRASERNGGIGVTVMDVLLHDLEMRAPAQARIGKRRRPVVTEWSERLTRVGPPESHQWVGPDVLVSIVSLVSIYGASRAAIEAVGAHRLELFQWIQLPTMAEPEADYVKDTRGAATLPAPGGGDLAGSLSAPTPLEAIEGFLEVWAGGLPQASAQPDEPLILARLRALNAQIGLYKYEVLEKYDHDAEGWGLPEGLLMFRGGSQGSTGWAHELGDEDPRVWAYDDGTESWSPTDQTLSEFLATDLISNCIESAPVSLIDRVHTEDQARSLLESFVPVAPPGRDSGSDGAHASRDAILYKHGVHIHAGAKTRDALASTSLSGWGGFLWFYPTDRPEIP